MKNSLTLFFQVLLLTSAGAQSSGEMDLETERQRISDQQRQQEIRYTHENSACYQKFAVSDCLNEVRVRRRQTMEDLKRQESALNDLERKQKGADQLKRLEEKTSSEAFDTELERRAEALKESAARLERIEQKSAERMKREAELSESPVSPRKPSNSSASEESRADAKKTFSDRQKTANESRARRERALAEKQNKKISPLPSQPE